MAETNYDLGRDLDEAKSMADGLEDYVRGDELYGSGSGGMFGTDPRLPKLTIGALLLRLKRLQAQKDKLSSAQWSTLTDAQTEHDRVRREWTVHYMEKLQREATSRLQGIGVFISECAEHPGDCANNYLPTAQARTILQAALDALPSGTEIGAGVQGTDSRLRGLTEPSAFLWSPALESLYPKGVYWWLYARPKKG
jgi:hypothetical protein